VTEHVVDRLEPIEVDLEKPVDKARATDMSADRPEVLVESSPGAGPGQRIRPGRELELVMYALELDHIDGGPGL
jgi:hypothetical protein